jgi:GDPmannose 4,6-dehydratase
MSKKALITGISGQDGSYLAELLLEKGYEVYGMVRRLSSPNFDRISHIVDKITLMDGDLTDQSSLDTIVQTVKPDEIYNLAAQSFVPTSWLQPTLTGNVTGVGVARLLEAARRNCKDAKIYQASSSEMFGLVDTSFQDEKTPFHPRSPYACSKVFAYHLAINYRESYGVFVCNGISFNHESPRRGFEFVTRKITNSVARIYYGLDKQLKLGNLDAQRDWGFAGDYVKAMWLMLQQDKPDDYVVATGVTHSVKEFVDIAFREAGLNWKDYVVVDEQFYRPADVHFLRGDASKARKALGWKPEVTFEQLIKIMVKADLQRVKVSVGSSK